MKSGKLDSLGERIAEAALTAFVRLCPEAREAAPEQLEPALAAMRAASPKVMDELMDNLKEAPWIAEQAGQLAVMTLAEAGVKAFRQEERAPS
jgi:hypothetical protein